MNSLNSKWLQEAYSCHGLKKYVENMPVMDLQPCFKSHSIHGLRGSPVRL